jgi:hypothetical protein
VAQSATAPFIPVPEIGADPNGGTTLGILPVWLRTNEQDEIDRIIAPDLFHNSHFGWGMHARWYAYSSEDEQWSVVNGGVGFRGIARPLVAGYVDVGYGSEGAAVFTGINYPF